jgi:leucyl aminopeptidase
MRTLLSNELVDRLEADLLLVPVIARGDGKRSADGLGEDAAVRRLDDALDGRLVSEARRHGFGKGREFLFQTHGALPSANVLLVSCPADGGPRPWYELADLIVRTLGSLRARRAVIALWSDAACANAGPLAEGIALARYAFTRFRSAVQTAPSLRLTFAVRKTNAALRAALERSRITAEATCLARDLANTPAAALPPAALADAARRIAGGRVSVKIHDRKALARLGMGALLGVGAGSREPPCLIEMAYRPRAKARRRIALVGKGITFDSGGLSLKNADAMQSQKRDMAGGAVVLGVMQGLAELEPPIEVRGYVPAAENMPGGAAMKPGDVLRAWNGRTIEVLNTDAEGRLVLADALSYAASHRPDAIVDFATLTAAVRQALGSRYAAILGTDAGLIRDVIDAGRAADENLWELPLAEEYRRDIDSRVADLKNVGEGQAGTIIGALFLREFVGAVPWAHVDFSSTVMSDGYPCQPKGATGFGVRTMLGWLERLAGARA